LRVAEPEGLARRLPLLANGVTDQGLGGESEANGAGNAVLAAVAISFIRNGAILLVESLPTPDGAIEIQSPISPAFDNLAGGLTTAWQL
jgi:hypothetical protein